MNFCSHCGAPVSFTIPQGDDRPRYVCKTCRSIHYQNPKIVVGCIPEWGDKILLCRRAIEPGYGKWTLPAGYLETGETVYEGVKRETIEEAGAEIADLRPYALLNLAFASQVYLMFRARLLRVDFTPGGESLAIEYFEEADIPWDEIAFSVIRDTLLLYFNDRLSGSFSFRVRDILPGAWEGIPARQ